MKSLNEWVKEMTTWGTPACGVLCGILGALLAILLLTIGYRKTQLVAVQCAMGA